MKTGMIRRNMLDVRIIVEKVANDVPAGVTPSKGMQFIVGDTPAGSFASGATNDLAIYNGTAWKFYKPDVLQLEIFDLDTNSFKAWDGTAWVVKKTISAGLNVETHTLTAAEATAKAFDLTGVVKTGEEDKVIVFMQGVTQYAGEAFNITTTSNVSKLTWVATDVTLMEGDLFTLIYSV